jgi:diguanylate cyclase (GGDEF)-like protein
MDDKQQKTLSEKLAELQAVYLARLPGELASLQSLAETLRGGERDRVNLEALHQRLHKLTGAGGSFGLAELSEAARVLEQRVKGWLDGDLTSLDIASLGSLTKDLAALHTTVSGAEPAQQYSAPPDAVSVPGKILSIWMVEDDTELGRMLMHQLESFNYQVRLFEHIEQAECAAKNESPDLLIMDVMFASDEVNTTEVLAQYPTLQSLEIPLLFITAHDDFASRVRASRLGAVGYVLKPINVPELVNRIAHIFEQRRAPPQRVLIVDDDKDLAERMRLVLLAANMEVEVLQSPQEIMQEIAAFRPELVLLDLYMPDFSGPDLAGVIRQHDKYANLPIVYLSAETDIEQQIEAMERGADDFLTKPISDLQLVAAARARIARARQLEEQISKDSLTGLLKHASIKEAVELEVKRAQRPAKPVTLAMLDIDHFKAVNDNYGHAMGDVVIAAVATLLRQRLRDSDILGRYGGEEFVVILPECDEQNARAMLDDLRQRFASLNYRSDEQDFSCTISAGLACSTQFPGSDGAELLVAADEALYKAKRGGRNQVQVADPS